jgi:hypothetical protein
MSSSRCAKPGRRRDELEKAVRATLSSQVRTLTTVKGQAGSIGNGWLLAGSLDYQRQFLAAISALTPRPFATSHGAICCPTPSAPSSSVRTSKRQSPFKLSIRLRTA